MDKNIKKLRNKMLKWKDFYGQDIVETDKIKSAKTIKGLNKILNNHISFIEMQNLDAMSHAESFRKELGLSAF